MIHARRSRETSACKGPRVGFVVGAYDSSRALVIDPTLNYAAYVGRSVNDKVNGIALGSDGSTYVSGIAPAMTASVQNEAFVAHISADGKTLLYMTYFGGSATTEARGLAVDAAGYAYITGFTQATDFPVQGALQPSCSLDAKEVCEGQAFITKLNPGGSLNFSTFLGGSGTDAGNAIALDAAGNIYVAGSTTSTNFPIVHAAQVSSAGKGDAFVAKIAGDGSQVVYATYLGGSGTDEALGIAVDGNASAYVTGQTQSVDFPAENPLQAQCALNSSNHCLGEAFVAKLTPDGSSLVYSTYLGGSGGDSGNAIAVDAAGNAYLAGATSSQDFPVLSPLQKQAKGTSQAFITKVRPDGTALVYSTYLGGSGTDSATSIAVDKFGHAFVSGQTDSADFPTMKPVQASCHKNTGGTCTEDAFLAVFSSGGSTLRFSTYLGGSGVDEGRGIALDARGNAYMGGASTSGDFPMAIPVAVTSKSSVLNASGTSSPATSGTSGSSGTPLSVPSGGGVVAMFSGLPNQAPQVACSGSINWVGTAGDNKWTTVTNWDKGVLPVSTDTVCIGTAFSSATITIDSLTSAANQTITSLVSNSNITFTTGPLSVSDGAEFVNALSITSGTLTLSGTAGSSVGTTMTQSGGMISGTDTLTVSGLLTWSGGSVCTTVSSGACAAPSGSGGTMIASGGMSLSGGDILNGWTLNTSAGTVTVTSAGGYMGITGGATVNNTTTWSVGGSYQLYSSAQIGGAGSGTFNNNVGGTFTKSDTSTSAVDVPFSNTGTVQANAGTLNMNVVGTCTTACNGSWSAASGAVLELSSGSGNTSTLSGGISGAGTVDFGTSQGTINVTGVYNVTGGTQSTGGTTNFIAPGTVTNVGALTISSGLLNFSTGASANANTITAPTMNLSSGILFGTDQVTISGLTTWTGGSLCTTVSSGACTTPTGTQGITTPSGGMSLSGGDILDGRTLNTSAGTVTVTSAGGYMGITGGATVNNTTTWSVGGSYQLYSSAQIGGAGSGTFNNNVGGTFTKSDTSTSAVDVPFSNTGTVQANAGTLNMNVVGTCTTACNGSWSAASGAVLELSSGSGNTSTLSGGISGAGTVDFGTSQGTINVTGVYNVTGGTQSTGGTTNFIAPGTVTNVGALTISSGLLNFSTGASANANTITAPTMNLSSGILFGTDQVTISGLTTWTGGSLCTTVSSGACTTPTGTQGITTPSGGMSLSGGDILDGRTLNTSAGTVTVTSAGGYMGITGGATVNNTTTWSVGGSYQLYSSAQIGGAGSGTFNNNVGGTFTKSDTSTSAVDVPFSNTGTVQANAGTLNMNVVGTCTTACNGSWSAASGAVLELSSGSGNTSTLSGGISGAGTVDFGTSQGTINVTGVYNVTGGTQSTGGTTNFIAPGTVTNVGALTISSGLLNFSTGASANANTITAPTMNLSSGILFGTDQVTISGLTTWTGGSLCTTVSSGACTTPTGTQAITNPNGGGSFSGGDILDGRTLKTSAGTVTITSTGGYMGITDGGTVNNTTTWSVGGSYQFYSSAQIGGAGSGTFNNNVGGTFTKSDSSTSNIYVPFNNTGTVLANLGILSISAAFTQTTGNTSLNGGGIDTSAANPLQIQGGTLMGAGTIAGDVSNTGGTLAPGASTAVGAISLNGSGLGIYTQGSGTYSVKIGSTSSFDSVSATGAVTLAGTLNVSLINSFSPALSNTFTILTAGSVSGTFGTTNLPALSSGLGWKVTYNATSVVLSVVSVSSPVVTLPTTSLTFPNTIVGTSSPVNRTAILENTGTAPLIITSIVPTGADAGNYSYSTDATQPCPISPATLGNGSSCVLDVTFTPASAGTHNNAQLTITDNNGNVAGSTQTISLAGTGIQLTSIAVTPSPSTVTMGSKIQFTATGTYSDSSTQSLTNTATWNSSNTSVATISNTSGTQGQATGLTGGTSNITAVQGSITSTPLDVLTVTTATHFSVSAPGASTENTPFNFTVNALDQNNNTVPGYSGTVHFTSTDSQATLPANSTLTSGSGTFSATLKTAGSQTITATDTVTTTITGISNAISVSTGTAASITATSGTPQSAAISTAFAAPLVATVKDSGGNPVQGVTVTFTAPGSGASGSFAGGIKTATTNSSGVATSAVFTANAIAGSYTVAATVAGVTTAANFALTNTAGTASSITATSGTPQSAGINTAFAAPLVATVKDSGGNPVQGVTVTFTAPASGASGSFAGSNTATTNASGVATSTVFTANATAGSYTVAATVAGVTTAANFALTNTAGTASSITATSGTPQSAAISTAFAAPLVATVKDSGGNPVQGVTVTFTAPASGASGSFAGSNTATTNASGVATSTVFTANATAGSYTVAATVAGVTTAANFALTNTAGTASSITATSGTPQSAAISTAFAAPLVATVKDSGGNPVQGVTVTFTAPASGASGSFAGGAIRPPRTPAE